jgi:hypothetical protein
MLYATIRALGSLPSVALSPLMAIVSCLIMLLPESVKSKRVKGIVLDQTTSFYVVDPAKGQKFACALMSA